MKTRNSNLTGPGTSKNKDYPAIRVFSQWVAYLRATFEHKEIEDTSTAIFRLLFPDMDVNRRFDMQEARLAQHLIRILGTSTRVNATGSRLSRWSADGSSGCLGVEVREILAAAPGVSTTPEIALDGGLVIQNRQSISALAPAYFMSIGC